MSTEIRIVLVGKTGAGKSSLGNTLLGKNVFQVTAGMTSGTQSVQVDCAERFTTFIKVTDTPGLCDTDLSEHYIQHEVQDSLSAVWPGPHAIVFVLRCNARFSKEEYNVFTAIKRLFGPQVCRHMMVVFNGIDALDDTPVKQRHALTHEVQHSDPNLRSVMQDLGFRYYGVNNKASWSSRDQQAVNIIQSILNLKARNNGRYFPCEPDLESDDSDDDSDDSSDEY